VLGVKGVWSRGLTSRPLSLEPPTADSTRPSCAGANITTPLRTPLVQFKSPRALDIDAEAFLAEARAGAAAGGAVPSALSLTAAPATAPSAAVAGTSLSIGAPAPAAEHLTSPSAASMPAPTPATRREPSRPQPVRGTLPPLTLEELQQRKAEADEEAAADEAAAAVDAEEPGAAIEDDSVPTGAAAVPIPTPPVSEVAATMPPSVSRIRAGDDGEDEGYIVRPYSMARLRELPDDELRQIDNFEVSRPGYGTLRWPRRTDVRALVEHGLKAVLCIEKHLVKLYQGSVPKPSVGEGLNKECEYTMEDVWARGPSGEYLQDARSLERFRRELQRSAEKFGAARVVGYDAERGEWIVELAHW